LPLLSEELGRLIRIERWEERDGGQARLRLVAA